MSPFMGKIDVDFLIRSLSLMERDDDHYRSIVNALKTIHNKMADADSILMSPGWVELLIESLQHQAVRHVGCQVPSGIEVIKKCALLIAALKQLQDLAAENV